MFSALFEIEIGGNMLTLLTLLVVTAGQILSSKRTKELRPNGGNSMHDKVDKMYRLTEKRSHGTESLNEDGNDERVIDSE